MNEEFIGTVALFPYDAIPYGYLKCDGSVVLIVRYAQLFSLLQTSFGGNGTNNFGLPDLSYNVPVGKGPGRHGVNLSFGETGGTETFALTALNLAAHTHPVTGQAFIGATEKDDESSDSPKDSYLRMTSGVNTYADSANAEMGGTSFEVTFNNAGHSQRLNNMQPTMAMVYAICYQGKMPIRS